MKFLLFLLTSAFLMPTLTWASGYQMRYQSAETMGTAFASDVSGAKTASGFYNNPSLLGNMDEGIHVGVELMGLFPMGDFEDGFSALGGDPEESGFSNTSFIPSIYYGQKFTENYGLVVSFTVPWATSTEYSKDWVGRFHAVKTYLASYNLSPSFVYTMDEKWTFSVGPQIQMMTGELSQALPPPAPAGTIYSVEGDSLGFGLTASATYQMSEALRLALSYKSRVTNNLKGEQSISPNIGPTPLGSNGDDVELELVTPDVLTLGGSYRLNERLDVHGTLSWTSWSTFEELKVENQDTGSSAATTTEWKNTYFLAAGADYYHNDTWTFRGGLSYETGAPPDEYRTPRSVDEDRATIGLGTSYALSETMQIHGALTQLFYTTDPEITAENNDDSFEGTYKGTMATALRVGLSARF